MKYQVLFSLKKKNEKKKIFINVVCAVVIGALRAKSRPQFERSTLSSTVKILKIGTPEIITIIILQFEQLDFTVQYCVQKMQTE